jgi:hypothetical protein
MRTSALLALVVACAALTRTAAAQPTAVPTPAGAGAVAPSDQKAVRPGLPDERANPILDLGTAPPTPAPLPPPLPLPAAASSSATPVRSPAPVEEPGRSEPDTGESPAAAGSVHRKPGVAGRPVSVAKAPPLTVVAYEPGKTLTLRRAEGTTVTYPLAKKSDVPKGLAPGQFVTIKTRAEHGKRVVTRVREASETPVLTNVN